MLNNREIKILEELIKNGNICENDILEKNKINKRVFSYNLQNINVFLQNMKLKKVKKEGKTICFDNNQNFENVHSVIKSMRKFDREERIGILEFILFFKENINLKKISQELEVSKTTLKKDFRILKNILNRKKIKILYKNNFGYYLEYKDHENMEWMKIKKLEKILFQYEEEKKMYSEFIKKMYIFNNEKAEEKKISDFLYDINEKLKLNIGDEAYKILYSYLLVIKDEKIEKEKQSLLFIEKTEEFKIIENSLIKNGIAVLHKNSIIKFVDFLMGVTISSLNLENWLNQEILIRKIMKKFFQYANLSVNEDEVLYECLIYHLKPTIYRIKRGIHISNPVFRELIENGDPILKISEKVMKVIEKEIGISFPEDEIALLGYHFKASVERNSENAKKKIILVCGLGEGTSRLLEQKLKKDFNVEISAVIPYYKLEETLNSDIKADLILTTPKLKNIYKIPILKINPLLEEKDINKMMKYGISKRKNKILMSELLKIIEENNNNKENLRIILNRRFRESIFDDIDPLSNKISHFINYSDIIISDRKMNWREGIEAVGKYMCMQGYVTKEYICEMLDIVEKFGSYIVVEEGIAIPHGNISKNVLKNGILLLICKQPVFLPNEKKVNIFIGFAIKEKENRQEIIKFLFDLITRKNLMKNLMKCKNTKEVYRYLEEI